MFSPRKNSTSYLKDDLGTMPSNSTPISNRSIAKPILFHQKNNDSLNYSSKKTFAPDEFNHRNHPWLHPSFLSRKKMEAYALLRTTVNLTMLQSKIATHSLSSAISSITLWMPNYFQKWTYDGDTTIFVSKKVMNGKPHSAPTSDSSNRP